MRPLKIERLGDAVQGVVPDDALRAALERLYLAGATGTDLTLTGAEAAAVDRALRAYRALVVEAVGPDLRHGTDHLATAFCALDARTGLKGGAK